MTARDDLTNAMWDNLRSTQKELLIDAFAHELAREIRQHGTHMGEVNEHATLYADLIDPEA